MEERNIIYIDESGNTESGFKDKKQLFITFASHSATEDSCQKALKKKFPKRQSCEVKYVNLGKKRRVSTCIATLEFIKKIDANACFIAYTVYKPLFLFNSFLTFFHDSAIEANFPHFKTGSFDFIWERMHRCWFNFLRYQGPTFLSELIGCYVALSSNRDEKEFNKLIEMIRFSSENGCLISPLIQIYLKSLTFNQVINRLDLELNGIEPSWTDTTLPCIVKLLLHWGSFFKGHAFDAIHDKSSPLSKRKGILDALRETMSLELKKEKSEIDPNTFYILSNGLPMRNIYFEDSKNYFGLQIADLLAGLINDFAKPIDSANEKNSAEKSIEYFDRLSNFMPNENLITMIPDVRLADEDDVSYLQEKQIPIFL